MTLTVVRERMGNKPIKAAEVSIEGQQLRIKSDTKVLTKLIKSILPIPTMIKTRNGNKITKTWPVNAQENLRATLKQNLYDPYRLAQNEEKPEDGFRGEHEEIVTLNFLKGEERHLVGEKAS